MRTRQVFLDRLDAEMTPHDVVVVIDVLRSFSTAAYAFAAGASLIYPVETIAAASPPAGRHARRPDNRSRRGGDPIPGFDFGNTPTVFQNLRLDNRPLIQSTAAGAHGITRFNQVRALSPAALFAPALPPRQSLR